MKTALLLAPFIVIAGALPATAQSTTQTTTQTEQRTGGVVQDVRDAINREISGKPAPAQQQTGTTVLTGTYLREVDENEPLLGPGNMTVRQMEHAVITDASGKRVGKVEEVIANNRGQLVGVAAEVGGFLGLGEKEVLIPLEHLTPHNGQFRTALTVDQLKALPKWDDD